MSDSPFLLPQPPRVTAEEARETARAWKGMADHLRGIRDAAGARHAMTESQWWLAYAHVLSVTNRTDDQ
jgi:hypothetical protein